ncbi:G-protein coupled receptor family C group 5 member C [Latimeria chalumnae]|uniref:G protein-coupled receptor class C group 5 member C n=1 Tax=Latimeria chalumnae TaxID=7897 RepID=H3BCY6_LATCH|nr:PREDICTED: G-protein coupled receptor family C group 5 member C [Latimeria chalumnae]|eukprot:XP_005988138.1 PREDICTED: G-protein coupled receptor family C group 5 member C [Latimeria chalumnae]
MATATLLLVSWWALLFIFSTTKAEGTTTAAAPRGCYQSLPAIYFNLCDLSAVWGIVLVAFTAIGIVVTFVTFLVMLASIPFIEEGKRRSALGIQVTFLVGIFGLFSLVFAFIIGKSFSSCAARRFLFGVLFATCFSSLLAHAFRLNFLVRKNDGPRGWLVTLIALSLILVEVIINTEWLIITTARNGTDTLGDPCNIPNGDFVMALIYVMFLMFATLVVTLPALRGRYKHWKKHGLFILITTSLSIVIWVIWIVMYLYGNSKVGNQTWDDPTLGIALVVNAWTFLCFYTIPEISQLTKPRQEGNEDDAYQSRGVGYDTILKEQTSQSMFVENKAFSMDEPNSANVPVSPYSGYDGLRNKIYQPTAMAIINQSTPDSQYANILPRVQAFTLPVSNNSSTLRAEDARPAQSRQNFQQERRNVHV